MTLPLAGLRVLDVASFIAAPVAATVMGDYGADVIKVEPPGTGDPNRHMVATLASYPKSPVNYAWHLDSRGKRSMALDLKTDDGQAAMHRLVKTADVLITNYPLDVRARLKISYDDVAALNPRLIYASFTGYGEAGPDMHQLGFDSTAFFARSGLLDCNRYDGQPPGVAMPGQGDRVSGMALLAGILMALLQRGQSGSGQHVKSSLYANGLWSNGVGAQAALVDAFLPPRPTRLTPRNPLTNMYRSRDDRWMQLTIVREDRQWPSFCKMMGRSDLEADPRFVTSDQRRAHGAALVAILDPLFERETWAHWRAQFIEHGIPCGLVGKLEDLPTDAQAVASGAVVETTIPAMPLTLAAPFQIAGMPPNVATAGPALGADTDALLAELGYGRAEIVRLRQSGAVA